MPLQQRGIIRRDSFDRLAQGFNFVLAVIRIIFDARKQNHRRRILDDKRAFFHARRSAVANDASHAGVAAVVHGGVQTAFVNQPLFVGVLPNVAGFDALKCSPGGVVAPSHPVAHAPLRGLLQRDSDIDGLTRRSGEPLDHDVVRAGSECLTSPVAALVRPGDFYFTVLEIDGAEIVLDRRGFRKIKLHQERRDCEVRLGILLDGAFIHALDSKRHGFGVFAVQHHLPHLRKDVRDVGRLQRVLPRHEQAFVVEKDLLRVGIAHQLDVHRAIAGNETLADQVAWRDAAKSPPRHDLPPDPFRQRHRQNRIRSGGRRRLWQEPIALHAVKIFSRTIVRRRRSCI